MSRVIAALSTRSSPSFSTPRCLLLAGGTGGHIVPGIALALELRSRGVEVHFLSLGKNRNYADFAQLELPLHFYAAPPLARKALSVESLLFPWRFLKAFGQALKILKKQRINIVVGMGGYSMLPALLAARILRRPYYLCEQNAVAGRATRLFAGGARVLFLNFPLKHRSKAFEKVTICQNGNPLRPGLIQKLKHFTQEKRKTGQLLHILVLGGSQGALQINTMVSQIVPHFHLECRWTIQCGPKHLDNLTQELKPYPNVKLLGYTANIEELYTQASLLICRAGAGILSEALCFGLPMLLIPYPYAADAHQQANSDHLAHAGAAIVFKQRDTRPRALLETLQWLKANPQELGSMSQAALSLALPEAAQKISSVILAGKTIQ